MSILEEVVKNGIYLKVQLEFLNIVLGYEEVCRGNCYSYARICI